MSIKGEAEQERCEAAHDPRPTYRSYNETAPNYACFNIRSMIIQPIERQHLFASKAAIVLIFLVVSTCMKTDRGKDEI